MIFTSRSIVILLIAGLVAAGGALSPGLLGLGVGLAGVWGVLALADLAMGLKVRDMEVERRVGSRLSLGGDNRVQIRVMNRGDGRWS